jgi:signal transduction histidine kinase
MRLGIRTKQVAGVTALVTLVAAVLFVWFLAALAHVLLEGSRANARFLTSALYQRMFTVVSQGGDSTAALAADSGLRSILEGAAYMEVVDYAVIVDPHGNVVADVDPSRIGKPISPKASLDELIDTQGPIAQLRAIYTEGGRTLEVSQPLLIGNVELGSIRVGVSTLFLRSKLIPQLRTPVLTAGGIVAASVLVAMLLAQLVLRPIHVIRSGLARLGRGELGVNVDLPGDAELTEIGDSFQQVSARLAADRTELAGQRALESVVDQLEDAVALFSPSGALLFSNAAMDAAIDAASEEGRRARAAAGTSQPSVQQLWPADHPYRRAVENTLAGGAPNTPAPITIPAQGDRLVLTNLVPGATGEPLGVVLVSRNLTYLSQIESTMSYSRKLAALSRLTAGIAHEIKNPLNATMIHLELLRMELSTQTDALQHLSVIADQVRRLDDVVQGFMKFTRPEDLKLEAVELASVFERVTPVLETEAGKHGIDLRIDVPADLPRVEGDPNLLEQAFLNLGLNACQAMPQGGRLRIAARAAAGRLVKIDVEDTGVGIPPEHLSRIFDLYFTTKPEGSGIGLSLVFRTVQLHDGEIEVQSTPGRGTTFKVTLRQA